MKTAIKLVVPVVVILLTAFHSNVSVQQSTPWVAPSSADTIQNPLKNNPAAVTEGKKLYDKYCWTCHGKSGKGDGPGAKTLNPKPADHTSPVVQNQSDGAIWWKISKGRGQMSPYEKSLNKNQRWQLVCYIRSMAATQQTK
ncbi:MAG: c-type cytochrome [Bacteroidia bacterium]|nr:c-type cytochrome [Bacteroidia bacterium]